MQIIDAHAHFLSAHTDALSGLLEHEIKTLGVCVPLAPGLEWYEKQASVYQRLAAGSPQRRAWCTGIEVPAAVVDGNYVERVIADLDRDFARGAVAAKVWKNLGMELVDAAGRFRMVDDALFEPIFAHLERLRRPVLMHIAEPYACWLPLDVDTPHASYYRDNPKWHMYGRPEVPSHEQLMAARDRVIERHPKLPVIGAHLASLEHDLVAIAARLDRYANFAIDTSGRLPDLACHGEAARQFIERYQDRILWGTDLGARPPKTDADRDGSLRWLSSSYRDEFRYYETTDTFEIRGREIHGLGLPQRILEKLYADNARRWYPGL